MNISQTEKIKIKWKYIKGKEYEKVLSLFIDYNLRSDEFLFSNKKFEIIWQSDYSLLLMKDDMDRGKGVYIIAVSPLDEIWKKETVARTLLKRHPELIQKL